METKQEKQEAKEFKKKELEALKEQTRAMTNLANQNDKNSRRFAWEAILYSNLKIKETLEIHLVNAELNPQTRSNMIERLRLLEDELEEMKCDGPDDLRETHK